MTRGNLAAEANAHRFSEAGGTGIVVRFGWFYGPGAAHSERLLALARATGTTMWLRGPGWAALVFGDRLTSLTAPCASATRGSGPRSGGRRAIPAPGRAGSPLRQLSTQPKHSMTPPRRPLKERALMAGEHARRRRIVIVGDGSAEALAIGKMAQVTDMVARLTGRPPRTFAELAHDLVAAA